jgi:fibronectin-binding autotransporter adhesin
MARYNSVIPTTTTTTTSTVAAPRAGEFTKFTGTSYTVTIGDPALYPGETQSFFNAASGTITLSCGGSGVFSGPGSTGTANQTMVAGSRLTIYSDGTNWITTFEGGTPLTATTGVFAGGVSGVTTLAVGGAVTGVTTLSQSGQHSMTGATGLNFVSSSTDDSTSDTTGAATMAGGLAVNKNVTIGKAGNTGKLRLMGSSSGTITFQAAATAGSATYTFPAADAVATGYALTSNGLGTLSWSNVSATVAATTTNASFYPVLSASTTGQLTTANVSSAGLTFNPSTNTLLVDGTVNQLYTEVTVATSRALALTDRDKVVNCTNTSPTNITITISSDSTAAFPVGSKVWIYRSGSGTVTIAADSGVTLNKTGTMGLGEEFYLRKRASNNWVVVDSPTNINLSATTTGSAATVGSTTQVTFASAGGFSSAFTVSS